MAAEEAVMQVAMAAVVAAVVLLLPAVQEQGELVTLRQLHQLKVLMAPLAQLERRTMAAVAVARAWLGPALMVVRERQTALQVRL
jgi:hypothetical protein